MSLQMSDGFIHRALSGFERRVGLLNGDLLRGDDQMTLPYPLPKIPGIGPEETRDRGPEPVQVHPGLAPRPAPVRFDPAPAAPRAISQRITRDELGRAAVMSRPHPSLPPESPATGNHRALELRHYWGQILLGVQHHVEPRAITIGESKRTDIFISSEGLPAETFPLVRYEPGDYVLSFTHTMTGEIEMDGEVYTLAALRKGMAHRDPELHGTFNIVLPVDARVLVHWGGASFAMRFVAPSRAATDSRGMLLDLGLVNTLLLSLFAHLTVVVTMLVYPYDVQEVDLDAGIQKIIEVLDWPEQPPDPAVPVPDPTPQPTQRAEANPTPSASPRPKVTRATPQSLNAAAVQARFRNMLAPGRGAGGLLGGRPLSTTLGELIGSVPRLGEQLVETARGDIGGGDPGGSSLSIAGVDTGPTGDWNAGRLGPRRHGPKIAVPRDKRCRGPGCLEMRDIIMGDGLHREVIKGVINRQRGQVRFCYERGLERNADIGGRIVLHWIIAATGKVAKVKIVESSIGDPVVGHCIAERIRTWVFPEPAGGGIVEVRYPFILQAR